MFACLQELCLTPDCSYSQTIAKLQQDKVERDAAHMEMNDDDDTVVEARFPNDPFSILVNPYLICTETS